VRSAEAFSQDRRFHSVDTDAARGCIRSGKHAYDAVGGLAVLRGNLAPASCVVKAAAVPPNMLRFTGRAICFDAMEDALAAIEADRVKPGHVVVIRYEGPRGGPGMREMLWPTGMLWAKGLHTQVGLITDGRFSGASEGLSVGHVSPEAASGGSIALVEDGDEIAFDVPARQVELKVGRDELARRRAAMDARGAAAWRPARAPERSTWLRIYGAMATSADQGGGRDLARIAQAEAALPIDNGAC
jgi:dihydroxy-acid dehydratase